MNYFAGLGINPGLTATGSTGPGAYPLDNAGIMFTFTSVPSGAGAIIASLTGPVLVQNASGTYPLTVYPPAGGSINGQSSFSLGVGTVGVFEPIQAAANTWYVPTVASVPGFTVGLTANAGLTATGSNPGNAYQMTAPGLYSFAVVGGSTGATIASPAGPVAVEVASSAAYALLVYPNPAGSSPNINGATYYSVSQGKTTIFWPVNIAIGTWIASNG